MGQYYDKNNKNNLEKYIKSLKNSLSGIKKEVQKIKKQIPKEKIKEKTKVIATIAALMVGYGAHSLNDYMKETSHITTSAKEEQEKYMSLVSDNTHIAGYGPHNENISWYDTDSMALSVSTLENDFEIEKAVYGVYANIGNNKTECFNDFLRKLSGYVDETSYFYSLNTSKALDKYLNDKGIDLSEFNGYKRYIAEIKDYEEKRGKRL